MFECEVFSLATAGPFKLADVVVVRDEADGWLLFCVDKMDMVDELPHQLDSNPVDVDRAVDWTGTEAVVVVGVIVVGVGALDDRVWTRLARARTLAVPEVVGCRVLGLLLGVLVVVGPGFIIMEVDKKDADKELDKLAEDDAGGTTMKLPSNVLGCRPAWCLPTVVVVVVSKEAKELPNSKAMSISRNSRSKFIISSIGLGAAVVVVVVVAVGCSGAVVVVVGACLGLPKKTDSDKSASGGAEFHTPRTVSRIRSWAAEGEA